MGVQTLSCEIKLCLKAWNVFYSSFRELGDVGFVRPFLVWKCQVGPRILSVHGQNWGMAVHLYTLYSILYNVHVHLDTVHVYTLDGEAPLW